MIAQHAHSVSIVHFYPVCLHRVGGFEGGYLGKVRRGLKRRGWSVEMSLLCVAV
jgi:hypothetical protein